MLDTITRFVNTGVADGATRVALLKVLTAIGNNLSSQTLTSAGLVISAASSPLAKTGASATVAVAGGALVSVPAGTNTAALSGTITQNKFNVYVFSVDASGTLYTSMGTEGATLGAVQFPQPVAGRATLGFVYLNPTTANFVGGTTALDAANTNAVYVNTVGAFDPTIVI
jgi:hypothetical protein